MAEYTPEGDEIVTLEDGRRMVRTPGGGLVPEDWYVRLSESHEPPGVVGDPPRLYPVRGLGIRFLQKEEERIVDAEPDPHRRRALVLVQKLRYLIMCALNADVPGGVQAEDRKVAEERINAAWTAFHRANEIESLVRRSIEFAVESGAQWVWRMMEMFGADEKTALDEGVSRALEMISMYYPEYAARIDQRALAQAIAAFPRGPGRLPAGSVPKHELMARIEASAGLRPVASSTIRRNRSR